MNYSSHVFKTTLNNEEMLINTVNKKVFSINSDLDTLHKNHFFEGQENDCINDFLLRNNPNFGSFEIIPTWECNLRCGHCFVLHQLKKEDNDTIDIKKLLNFIKRYSLAYPSINININFIGGEPLLRFKECNDILKEIKRNIINEKTFKMTTNAIVDLNEEVLDFIEKLDSITVSLDGGKEEHNFQRKSFEDSFDPFEKTILNIEKLIDNGFRDKLIVQASMKDKFYTNKVMKKFHETLLVIGVRKEKIKFGNVYPTVVNPKPQKNYLEYLEMPKMHRNPCCKFRNMSSFVIDNSNNIYSNFFDIKNSLLGNLDSSLEEIKHKYIEQISKTMPALSDKKCLKCPVIGYCWGGCIAGNVFLNNKPSSHCNQEKLIEKVNLEAKNGTLIK